MIADVIKGFIILFVVFVPLERLFPLHQQKTFRREWATDATYYLTGFFIGRAGTVICIALAVLLADGTANSELQKWVSSQPIAWQFVEAMVIADVGYYLGHRLMHTVPWLWQFHTIHHSIEEMDWLAAVRVHPVDQLFTKLLQMIPLYWLGFSAQTFALFVLFSAAIAFCIHANTHLTLGPFKWVVATPEFHHWHHANQPGVRNKNLAAQLPLMDFLFGTLYMPPGQRPIRYGIPYSIPTNYFKQLMVPFERLATRHRRKRPMTSTQPLQKKPIYLRPVPLLLCLVLVGSATGGVGYAKAKNYSIKSMVYTFVAGFSTPKITTAELEQGKVKSVVVVDVRDAEEYAADHIGDSISVPLTEIKTGEGVEKIKRLANTDSSRVQSQPTIVLYCQSGPRSIEAYQILKDKGLNLVVLSGGIKAWRETVPQSKDMAILSRISSSTKLIPTIAHEKR
ncbi:MAG: sterol desaturase family protein [Oscillatoriales cyanobacterium C42_A2020_001]|nr:sterol desaturase family protein [Leptolyngbyaceae cyanobacterium C42_A2020_001]